MLSPYEAFMHLRLPLLHFVLLSCLGFAQTNPTDGSKAFTLRGEVIEDPGGHPLRKVDLRFTSRSGQKNDEYTATTDVEGKFQIEAVKPGRYHVLLDRSGFVQLGMQGRFGGTLTLESAADAKNLVFHMQAAAVITGKIVDTEGDPIPNASIQAMPPGPGGARFTGYQGFGNTNDLGDFRIPNLRPGKYLLLLSASGGPRVSKRVEADKDQSKEELNYVPTYYPGTLEKSEAVPLELHPGDETPVTFSPLASPTFFIRGTVVKPPNTSLADLMLRSQDNQAMRNAGGMAPDGSFEFRDLLPGSYTAYLIVIDPAALAEAQQGRQPQMQIMRLGRPLEITNANLEGVHLVPEGAGRIRGRFRMDKGQKFDWTQLSVMLTPDDPSSQFTSGGFPSGLSVAHAKADRSFDLPNVPAGEYHLALTSNSDALQDYFTQAVNLDGKDVAESGFTVSGGSYSLDVVVSPDGGTVEGTVVDTKGKPVPDATVVAAPNGERRKRFDVFGQDSSDAQGHFRLRGLISGEYTVLAWEEPEENVRDPEVIKSYQDRGEKVQVEEGTRKNVSVKVIPAAGDLP